MNRSIYHNDLEINQQNFQVIVAATSKNELQRALGLSGYATRTWQEWGEPTGQALKVTKRFPLTPFYRPAGSNEDFQPLLPDVHKTDAVLDLSEAAAYLFKKMQAVDPDSLRPGKRIWKSLKAAERNIKASMDKEYLYPLEERARGRMPHFSRYSLDEFFEWWLDYVQNQYKPFDFKGQEHIIGTMSDDDAAEQLGVHRITIVRYRQRKGIKSFTPINLDRYVPRYGKEPDADIAKDAGVSRELIQKDRVKRGIEAWAWGGVLNYSAGLRAAVGWANRGLAPVRIQVEAGPEEAEYPFDVWVHEGSRELEHEVAKDEEGVREWIRIFSEKYGGQGQGQAPQQEGGVI